MAGDLEGGGGGGVGGPIVVGVGSEAAIKRVSAS